MSVSAFKITKTFAFIELKILPIPSLRYKISKTTFSDFKTIEMLSTLKTDALLV